MANSMNFRQKITLSLLLTILLGGVAFAQVVEMPDPNLRAAVREALDIADRPEVKLDAAVLRRHLTGLDAGGRGISDLTGLEHATSLTTLFLHNNDISDLRALTPLVNLTFIRLHGNQIKDISPLSNLTELTTLPLDSNNITDISPLANLTRLMHLVLSNNNIMDVIPLASLTSLKHLELQNNRITDITPLEHLIHLEHLDTQNNPIFDPNSPIVDIPDPNLRTAIRDALNLPDDVPVNRDSMRQLTRLHAAHSQITDLAGLEHAISLTSLALHNNDISDLRALTPLVNLTSIRLHGNQINDLSPLANLPELATLLLSANNITNLSPLANLAQLTTLTLDHNNITDISPLANLINLEQLELHANLIADHSPVHHLSLATFFYDETCDLPPLPLQPRLENRTFPSLFAAWGGPGWIRTLTRPDLSDIENLASHDLWFSTPQFETYLQETSDSIQMVSPRGLNYSIESRDAFLDHNPNMVFLVDIDFRHARLTQYPEDWPYWLRDSSGNLVNADEEGRLFINFTHPGFQDRIVEQAVAVSKCGLFDGIMIDWWNDYSPLLVTRNPRTEYVGYETEIKAKINILERIRAETRPDFLIIGNTNRRKMPKTGEYLNGSFMETVIPRGAPGGHLEALLTQVENSLLWLEANLREPRINSLEGHSVPTEPPDSPTNLRWMRAFTTLSLTHSDGYVLFQTGGGHNHYWYDFWGADLGRPIGPKAQLYDEDIPGLYIREFTNGWAVYNHSGEAQVITLPEEVQGVESGLLSTEHALPNLDGEMYLRVEPKNPADVNGDGIVNILDLTIIAQGFGTDNLRGDVNGDGVVNVFDLVFVADQF